MPSKISCQIYTLGVFDSPKDYRYGYARAIYTDDKGKTRKIKAMLSESDYWQAVVAHLYGKPVILCGEITGDRQQKMYYPKLISEED